LRLLNDSLSKFLLAMRGVREARIVPMSKRACHIRQLLGIGAKIAKNNTGTKRLKEGANLVRIVSLSY
jgi:hypothetical protein